MLRFPEDAKLLIRSEIRPKTFQAILPEVIVEVVDDSAPTA